MSKKIRNVTRAAQILGDDMCMHITERTKGRNRAELNGFGVQGKKYMDEVINPIRRIFECDQLNAEKVRDFIVLGMRSVIEAIDSLDKEKLCTLEWRFESAKEHWESSSGAQQKFAYKAMRNCADRYAEKLEEIKKKHRLEYTEMQTVLFSACIKEEMRAKRTLPMPKDREQRLNKEKEFVLKLRSKL